MPNPIGPLRVLMIDDNPTDLEFVRNLLCQVPGGRFSFAAVGDLSSGLKLIESGGYDLLLLDLTLPDASGVSAVVSVREIAPALPILVISGSKNPTIAEDVLACGADGYVSKEEVTVERFTKVLKSVLPQHAAGRSDAGRRQLRSGRSSRGRTRTCDPTINSRLLYQLSYAGKSLGNPQEKF